MFLVERIIIIIGSCIKELKNLIIKVGILVLEIIE